MELRNNIILLGVFFIFLILGIFLRFYYADSFGYHDSEGKYIPSNPDGIYWVSDIKHEELWADVNIFRNEYFSFITFFGVILVGLIIVNYGTKSVGISTIFVIFMLFSRFLYTKSAIGYYDHDYLGLLVLMILVLLYSLQGDLYRYFIILSPLVVYVLNFVWDGLIPVAYLLILILFIEYLMRRLNWKFQIFKYILYLIFLYLVINDTFNPNFLISETLFKLSYVIYILPFIVIGLWLSLSNKRWFWHGILIFSTIILLHSGRMVVISFPLIFLSICVLIKREKHKNLLIVVVVLLFIFTQIGNYSHLDRFGTNEVDKGLFYLLDNTSKDSKILSWWDYGYLVEYISEREAIFKGNGNNGRLIQLSRFYCDGTIPSYDFDYFIHFSYQPEIINSILHYNGNSCNTSGYIDKLRLDNRFELEYSNDDIEIYRFKGKRI